MRRTLRRRLLVAMAAIAVGVLVVTGTTTLALARRAAVDRAHARLDERAPDVVEQLRSLSRILRARSLQGRGAPIGRLVSAVLRVSDGTLVTVRADGTIVEGIVGLTGEELAGGRGSPDPLPAGLTPDDLDLHALRAGEAQSGTVDRTAFLVEPIRVGPNAAAVLVLTEEIDSSVLTRARGFFLVGGALALVVAVIVSYYLARRLTRPLQAMGATAAAIAGGDLSARVELGRHPDDELADLARTLDGMAAQLEAARAHERDFLLSVSHDLRTPLTSIRGYAEALTDGTIPASEEQRRAAAVIAGESRRLERLVADLLDLARLDAHQFSLHPVEFDAGTTVRTASEAFLPAAEGLDLRLEVDAPERLPVHGDPERVGQIVANLVENALKYARSSIRVVVAPAAGGWELRVTDDGPGLDPSESGRVFERLFVSRSTPGRSVGTGLGLAIVGELAAAMGGSARVESSGAGATFVVRLAA